MRILYFTNPDKIDDTAITSFLEQRGHQVDRWCERIDLSLVQKLETEFIVSDRARSLIRADVLEQLPQRVINLHPSFLPWNRGYHPIYFSIKEGTQAGNTIHYIDETIDTGSIVAQRELVYSDQDTLRTAYDRTRAEMIALFQETWPLIERGENNSIAQTGEFSFHWKRDFDGVYESLPLGWDTPLSWIRGQK